MSDKSYRVVVLLIVVASLWLRAGFPVWAIAASPHDDQLYVRMARDLADGRWLGDYTSLTLARGMFFPLFIALAAIVSVPLKIAEQAAYLCASAFTSGIVSRRANSPLLGVTLFACLAFNPALWTVDLARVLREGVYVSVSLAVVALAIAVGFPAPEASARSRRRLGWAFGFLGACFWLTREEGFWLAPPLTVGGLMALVEILWPGWAWRNGAAGVRGLSKRLRTVLVPLSLALVAFAVTDWTVAALNYRKYGVFETNEYRARNFLRAYGAVTRLRPDAWKLYAPFPKAARESAYAVSPAARELAPALDGPLGEGWRREGCSHVNIHPCDEVPAGWFLFEFTEAVASAGHYRSASEALRFYGELADQINTACDRGQIVCLPQRATMRPPFRSEYLPRLRQSGVAVTKTLLQMGNRNVGSRPSMGSAAGIQFFADMVGPVNQPGTGALVLQGWATARSGVPAIRVRSRVLEAAVWTSIRILPAPDVLAVFPDLKAVRFVVETDCPVKNCDVVVEAAGEGPLIVPLDQVARGAHAQASTPQLFLDAVSVTGSDSRPFLVAAQHTIATMIARAYRVATPVLAILGAAGLLLGILLRRRGAIPVVPLALGWASVAAVVSRIAMLAYVDATAFPAIATQMASPASPFVILFTVLGLYSAWQCRRAIPSGHPRAVNRAFLDQIGAA